MKKLLLNRTKRAGIYDRWLHTLGGGEQMALAYAIALRDLGFATDLITHRTVERSKLEKKMGVDLHDISFRYVPNEVDYKLGKYTEEYDIFINNSFMDYVPNRSKFGILSVFFPGQLPLTVYELFQKSRFVPSLYGSFLFPIRYSNFRFESYKDNVLHKWLSRNSQILFTRNVTRLNFHLNFTQFAFSCIEQVSFSLDGKRITPIRRTLLHKKNQVSYQFHFLEKTQGKQLTIHLPKSYYSQSVSLVSLSVLHWRYLLINLLKKRFSHLEMSLQGGPFLTPLSRIYSYDLILSISRFSQHWMKSFWGLKSGLLFPPVSVDNFFAHTKKKNQIAHVGRFFLGGHTKGQLELIRAYKQLYDSGITNWQIHFIGSVNKEKIHQNYLHKCQEEAKGYPVFFHINVPFSKLREILAETKIYWHATGIYQDETKSPINMEHFGISTVEAMAAGCVPVVINKGGQKEVILDNCGFLWNTVDELLEHTQKLIKNDRLLKTMQKRAQKASRFFDKEMFTQRFTMYLQEHKVI